MSRRSGYAGGARNGGVRRTSYHGNADPATARRNFAAQYPFLCCDFDFIKVPARRQGAAVAAEYSDEAAAAAAASIQDAPVLFGQEHIVMGSSAPRRRRNTNNDGNNNDTEEADDDGGDGRRRRRRRRSRSQSSSSSSAANASEPIPRIPDLMPPQIEVMDDTPADRVCILCFEYLVNAALAPCGCNVFCMHCCSTLLDAGEPRCPLCRRSIQAVLPRRDVISSHVPDSGSSSAETTAAAAVVVAVPQLPPLDETVDDRNDGDATIVDQGTMSIMDAIRVTKRQNQNQNQGQDQDQIHRQD